MQRLRAPAALDERSRQIIEQGAMHRLCRPHTEIARRADQGLAEMMQPEAVDIDARGEGVVRAGDGASQFQSPAAVREGRAA